MTTNTLRRMPLKNLRFALGILAGGGAAVVVVAIALLTPWGRERYLDAYLAICLPYGQAALFVFLLLYGWKRVSWLFRALVIGWILALGVVAISTFWQRWPILPWNRAEAARTGESFMLALKANDYDTALALLSPSALADHHVDELQDPAARPVEWALEPVRPRNWRSNTVSMEGTATVADGEELPVRLGLSWFVDGWRVYEVVFGGPSQPGPDDLRPFRIYIYSCCEVQAPYFDALKLLLDKFL